MSIADAERLAQFVRSLPDFVVSENMDCNYNHMGATVADAVLQANLRYSTHVKPRVNRILAEYPVARTTTAVLALLRTISATDFLNWRGQDRADRFCHVLSLFASQGIDDEADLRNWLTGNDSPSKLRSIKGIGPKTVDYFRILVGVSTSAIDRHLRNFLWLAGLVPKGYGEDQAIINAAADILGIDRAHFDHSIWHYMSKRGMTSRIADCSRGRDGGNLQWT
ncbi:hypothetical protein [Cupriavidus sp. BIC8F]|uniref:hypothetical protein n=1 Tax=Cupriavidus sp. BIC8F TaxID=3079014 RepID=UPI0029163AD2|nr:hypothetical protein [Cupriavidus sp. BIC8F]